VLGEPGVGKSALLEDLAGSAAGDGVTVLRTQGLDIPAI
jgi:MoxR-like ATPase